jgi:hypothetical protein
MPFDHMSIKFLSIIQGSNHVIWVIKRVYWFVMACIRIRLAPLVTNIIENHVQHATIEPNKDQSPSEKEDKFFGYSIKSQQ